MIVYTNYKLYSQLAWVLNIELRTLQTFNSFRMNQTISHVNLSPQSTRNLVVSFRQQNRG